MNKNLVLIDADSLAYVCGYTETIEDAINKTDERIDNIISNTNADYISLFISKGKYFRHDIFPEYKGNRKGSPPKFMKTIKSYLEDKYKANFMKDVEADDLVNYWMNKKLVTFNNGSFEDFGLKDDEFLLEHKISNFELNTIMSAIDKDLLNSIPGKHWNFTFKKEDRTKEDSPIIKGWLVETGLSESKVFQFRQLIIGDSGDNIKGVESKGKSYAENLFPSYSSDETMFTLALSAYIAKYGNSNGVYEFQKNYRLLHMLDCDEDFMREVGEVPKFPNIIDVKTLQNEPIENNKKINF